MTADRQRSSVELRVRGERAVLTAGRHAAEPQSFPLGDELAAALHEWARVATAIRPTEPTAETVGVLRRRRHQVAGRAAPQLHRPVRHVDPVTDAPIVVDPQDPTPRRAPPAAHW